ncbi:MAG TPA: ABC transporter substrate-binding protein [Pyrinomonadaceae bacterium]|nr:ABC transporter substrate-binding protein [Pyrinomonadaceae bacterium]
MRASQIVSGFLLLILALALTTGCRTRGGAFTIALPDNISTLDPIGSATVDAASERVRVLMFNSLMRKNEKFEYVPELASDVKLAEDGLAYTFTLHDGVTFHDGKPLTSADAKYTLDTLLASNSGKSASFYEGSGANRQSYISSVEAPDARTLVIRLRKPWLQLYPNLVPVAIIPAGSAAIQKERPIGTGPYKYVRYDSSQQVLDLVANERYWEGTPAVSQLRVRVIGDANALQAELKSGRIEIAPLPTNLSPDAFKSLGQDPNLKVEQFPGANIVHLTFNTRSEPLDDARVRQAIAYAIDRESIIRDLLLGQARIAHSILPEGSWAYHAAQTYSYDPQRAKRLLDEAGFRDPDGDGPQMRFTKPIVFKISSASVATRQYAGVMQNSLKQVGIPVEIETAESNTLREQLLRGQFQMTTGQWIGGNQDPIFLRDLFTTTEIPTQDRAGRNRSRYSNPELDRILEEAINTADRERASRLYAQAQETLSREVPMLPLWYPANMVVARRGVENIHVRGDGDWSFVRQLTFNK